jgi:hypothetical protein
LRERIDRGDRIVEGISPGEVQRGRGRCGEAHTVYEADLVVSNALLPDLHAGGSPAVGIDDRGGPRGVDPARAVKSSGGEAGKYPAAARSQPTSFGT